MSGAMFHATARVLLAPLAVAVALMLLLLVEDVPSQAQPCLSEGDRDLARQIMIDSFDKALMSHTMLIFDVWMKDPGDQPKRAITGMRTGISAWARSRNAAINWDVPIC